VPLLPEARLVGYLYGVVRTVEFLARSCETGSMALEQQKSLNLLSAAEKRIPGGVNSPVRAFRNVRGKPFFTDRAEGAYIWDVDGNRYQDFVGTWGPAILGHAPAVVIDAVKATAERGTSFGIPNPLEVEMAELICDWVPSVEKVRMVNSGTEATMSCVRLARGFTGRDLIVKFEGCYHGHVDSLLVSAGSGALTHGKPDSAGIPAEFAGLTLALPFNDPRALEKVFREHGDRIAAVILEPVPANAGLILPQSGYLQSLREMCTKNGSLLIFDEVMTGFRVARGGVQELYGVVPDLTAMGKVIGGGLPVGAFGGRTDIMDNLSPEGPVYQAGTLSGNPLAMAAGLAQLHELERVGGWTQLEELGSHFETGMRNALQTHESNFVFHRIGSMFSLFFRESPVLNLEDVKASDTEGFAKFFHLCREAGLYFAPSPFETGFLSLAHTKEGLNEAVAVVSKALSRL
jgi:glutamate-1-semialdehyde 2,1-aminomutase